uniref:Membrane-spanning 4-domains subfamily A member 4D-like n=1 Tax=Neolamprologus brichardi TaxID=32507 RepID=A0A3Q4HI25_NEOBR
MRKTFVCDESMIITIPIGSLRDLRDGQLMPEKFHCVFRDSYKVFVIKGKPTPMGNYFHAFNNLCVLLLQFVVCGMLSFAAGKFPNMHVTKLSFSLNIISFFWSVAAFSLALVAQGISVLIMTLLVVENLIAIFLIYWLSKAVCREHFNTLPTVLLKQGD